MLRPYKLDVILRSPSLDMETQELHAWNPEDRSLNIFVKDDDRFTLHRHPVAQSTDCIRGKVRTYIFFNIMILYRWAILAGFMFGKWSGRKDSEGHMQLLVLELKVLVYMRLGTHLLSELILRAMVGI